MEAAQHHMGVRHTLGCFGNFDLRMKISQGEGRKFFIENVNFRQEEVGLENIS